jgi:hypothetical protein
VLSEPLSVASCARSVELVSPDVLAVLGVVGVVELGAEADGEVDAVALTVPDGLADGLVDAVVDPEGPAAVAARAADPVLLLPGAAVALRGAAVVRRGAAVVALGAEVVGFGCAVVRVGAGAGAGAAGRTDGAAPEPNRKPMEEPGLGS